MMGLPAARDAWESWESWPTCPSGRTSQVGMRCYGSVIGGWWGYGGCARQATDVLNDLAWWDGEGLWARLANESNSFAVIWEPVSRCRNADMVCWYHLAGYMLSDEMSPSSKLIFSYIFFIFYIFLIFLLLFSSQFVKAGNFPLPHLNPDDSG